MKKKLGLILICGMLLLPLRIEAARGCCSRHGGVGGCSSSGRQICNDGTLSPTCTCTSTVIYTYGCTDKNASNYNSKANKDDGSCIYNVYGCTDKLAKNYNSKANKDDGSCIMSISDDSNKNDNSSNQKSTDDSGILDTIVGIGAISGTAYLYNKKKKK